MSNRAPKEVAGPIAADADKRVQRSTRTVMAATLKLLAEAGLGGVTVDEVSKRSGVAKTTIYRHWPSRSALLLAACSNISAKPEAPDTGTLRGDLTALATNMARRLRSERWASMLPSIIDAAERDPELAEVHTRLHADFMAPLHTVITRAQARGELPRDRDPSHAVAAVAGPLFYRRWFSRQPLDESFVKSVIANVLGTSD